MACVNKNVIAMLLYYKLQHLSTRNLLSKCSCTTLLCCALKKDSRQTKIISILKKRTANYAKHETGNLKSYRRPMHHWQILPVNMRHFYKHTYLHLLTYVYILKLIGLCWLTLISYSDLYKSKHSCKGVDLMCFWYST